MSTYDDAIEKEIAAWPGASVTFGMRAKHREAVIAFDGQTRFVVFPSSPGDAYRGAKNKIADVRQALEELGAVRAPRLKNFGPKRERNQGVRRDMNIEPAPVRPDPWAPLRRIAQ